MKATPLIRASFFFILFCLLTPLNTPAQNVLIPGVADFQQPIPGSIGNPVTNVCAPVSAANIVFYWESVMGHANAVNVTGGVPQLNIADYLSYFMDTNNMGSPLRENGKTFPPLNGTYNIDIPAGFTEFIRWDISNPFTTPPPTMPPGKSGYYWYFFSDFIVGFPIHIAEMDAGMPDILCFSYWNPISYGASQVINGELVEFFDWGPPSSSSADPEEDWNDGFGEEGIGHAVTGVGYLKNYDPDGMGPAPQSDWFICHDNWPSTPVNVALPWHQPPWNVWRAVITVDPSSPFPLELVSLEAKARGSIIELNWSVASAPKNGHFEIERRLDSESNFKKIGKVDVAESQLDYTFTDFIETTAHIYYRLVQTNIEGKSHFSNVVSVKGAVSPLDLLVYPNPFVDQFTILLPDKMTSSLILEFFNLRGEKMLSKQLKNTGQGPITIKNISHLPPDVYYVYVQTKNRNYSKKVIKGLRKK